MMAAVLDCESLLSDPEGQPPRLGDEEETEQPVAGQSETRECENLDEGEKVKGRKEYGGG